MGRGRGIPMNEVAPGFYWHDDGCNVSPSCLDCPLPACKFDDPSGYHEWALWQGDERYAAIVDAYERHGCQVVATARRLGISRRTVNRALRRVRRRAA